MGLETGVEYIDDLVITNPLATGDPPSEGDDHIRNIKKAITQSLPNITGAVTATQAELNILDGVTATNSELNYLDLTTGPGTQEASKAVVADSNVNTGVSKVTELHIGASGSEVQVTSTPAELNHLDGVTGFIDDDSMATASATNFASGESIKAYVDANIPQAYTSSWYSITSGNLVSGAALAHGLGGHPQIIQHELKCIDAGGDGGYSQDDIINWFEFNTSSPINKGVSVTVDSTNLTIRYGSDASYAFSGLNKGTGSVTLFTNSKWNYRVNAIYFP
jgi:hypothetical protein